MTDQEIQQLAREIAENKIPRCAIKDKFQWETLVYAKEQGYKEVIEAILRTHCIVRRETILSQHAWYMQRMKEVSSARQTNRAKAIALEAAFGTELFEERSEK